MYHCITASVKIGQVGAFLNMDRVQCYTCTHARTLKEPLGVKDEEISDLLRRAAHSYQTRANGARRASGETTNVRQNPSVVQRLSKQLSKNNALIGTVCYSLVRRQEFFQDQTSLQGSQKF